jgi:hypothetical protein
LGSPDAAQLAAASADPGRALRTLAQDEEEPTGVRQGAVRALGVAWDDSARELTLAWMNDADSDRGLRRAAVQASAQHAADDDAVRAAVEQRLADEDAAVARAAVLGLADVSASRSALEALASAVDVPPQVRTALDQVLGVEATPAVPPTAVPQSSPETRPGRG